MTIFVTGLRGIPEVMGGVESHCEELLPRIKHVTPDMDITVLGREPYIGGETSEFKGIKIVPLPSPKSMHLEAIVSTFFAILYARFHGASVIHIHAIGPALLTPLARMLGLQVVVTHHGEDYQRAKWGFVARTALKWGERSALIWAHRVIAVSRSLEHRLKKVFPQSADKVVYIPNGASKLTDHGNADQILKELALEPGRFILAVARLVPEKGIHDLIEAYRLLPADDGRKLVIAGSANHDTPYARELLAQASDDILFLGYKPRSTLACLYEHSSCFVLPSHHEALPMVALEAASCGASVLLSDISANRNFELPAERYFAPANAKALSKALASPPPYCEQETAEIMARFDWDMAARKTALLYRDLVAPMRAPVHLPRLDKDADQSSI